MENGEIDFVTYVRTAYRVLWLKRVARKIEVERSIFYDPPLKLRNDRWVVSNLISGRTGTISFQSRLRIFLKGRTKRKEDDWERTKMEIGAHFHGWARKMMLSIMTAEWRDFHFHFSYFEIENKLLLFFRLGLIDKKVKSNTMAKGKSFFLNLEEKSGNDFSKDFVTPLRLASSSSSVIFKTILPKKVNYLARGGERRRHTCWTRRQFSLIFLIMKIVYLYRSSQFPTNRSVPSSILFPKDRTNVERKMQ